MSTIYTANPMFSERTLISISLFVFIYSSYL